MQRKKPQSHGCQREGTEGRGRNGLPVMERSRRGNKRDDRGNTVNAVAMVWFGDRWQLSPVSTV